MFNVRIAAAMGAGGVLAALLLAVPSMLPPALASEQPAHTLLSSMSELFPPPFDPGKLVNWDFEASPAISTEVVKQSAITKIGYGTTEMVYVVQTPSGTYSTDALTSPNIEYPGILKRRVGGHVGMAYWSNGHWVGRKFISAGSFVTITRFDGGQLVVTDDGMCVTRKDGVICN
jgi:hypothetical protein